MLQDEFIKAFAKHINAIREKQNLSYQEMADNCGMDKAQVYKICTKGVDLRASSIERLAKGLNVTIYELFNFKY